MQSRTVGGFGQPRIDHDDLGIVRVADHPFPQDRVSQAQVAADQHDAIGLFEVVVRVGWRIEAERLLVGDDRGRHALSRVPVTVPHPHPELGQRTQQRHLLGRNLPASQERDRFGPVTGLDRTKPRYELADRRIPIGRFQAPSRRLQQRGRRPIGCIENGQRFPTLRTGHAPVDRVPDGGSQIDRFAVLQTHLQAAAG